MKKILKYIVFFVVVIAILIILQNIVISIPNKYIEKNFTETVDYYKNKNNHETFLDIETDNSYLSNPLTIDIYSDALTMNMLWNSNINSDNMLKNQVMMKYYYDYFSGMGTNLYKTFYEEKEANTEYSRYWHGSIIYIKLLMIFFNVQEIFIVNYVLLFGLIIYLLILLFKKSIKLGIAFLVGLIAINIILIPMCFEYYFAILLSIIVSIISLKIIDREDKYFYYLLIFSGICSCFFDFLTCETLCLVLPLIIRIYLKKEYKNIKFKEIVKFIIKCTLIWGLSYTMTFLLKWLFSMIVFGPKELYDTWRKAKLRIFPKVYEGSYILVYFRILMNSFSYLFPINVFHFAPVLLLIILIFGIWVFIFDIKKKKDILLLMIISLIPILRLTLLFAHTLGHYFFDYRALMPIVIILLLIFIEGVLYETNNINSLFKRRKNVRKSNKRSKKLSSK